ncbi:MAG: ketosteroid isomerase [Actinobacteria bacterium]|nr:MAG: ketosteroid isomerase [Actinomycetota bacterium]
MSGPAMGGRGAEGADAPDEAAIRRIFASLEQGWEAGFLDAVRPDVRWEVLGSHPLAGDYRGVDAFVAGTSAALAPYLEAGVQLSVVGVLVKGRTAVVELVGTARRRDGREYTNEYCWIVDFDAEGRIEHVRSYLDSAAVAAAMTQQL